ncbi:MAG: 50S ribosomal protein L18e [Candidatus Micrarchaeota archaeon]|nr:50S ribosomal protein L18e [Candidatus Micrarchaeota archaeon]MDE1824589.1 50S ribosomal protein L18e [Candidatus Micrarchaeota archaeon]
MSSIKENDKVNEWLAALEELGREPKKQKMAAKLHALVGMPKRRRVKVNLNKLDRVSKDGESIIVPGKVLGEGRLTKKIRISAVDYSESAIEKLKESKSSMVKIRDIVKGEAKIIV